MQNWNYLSNIYRWLTQLNHLDKQLQRARMRDEITKQVLCVYNIFRNITSYILWKSINFVTFQLPKIGIWIYLFVIYVYCCWFWQILIKVDFCYKNKDTKVRNGIIIKNKSNRPVIRMGMNMFFCSISICSLMLNEQWKRQYNNAFKRVIS